MLRDKLEEEGVPAHLFERSKERVIEVSAQLLETVKKEGDFIGQLYWGSFARLCMPCPINNNDSHPMAGSLQCMILIFSATHIHISCYKSGAHHTREKDIFYLMWFLRFLSLSSITPLYIDIIILHISCIIFCMT